MKKKAKIQVGKLSNIPEKDVKALMQRLSLTRDAAMLKLVNKSLRG